MKFKPKTKYKKNLSDKIADALTVKPRADIEDDHIFGTKPKTLSRADLSLSESEDEATISDFRKRNVNLLSEVSKKYEGQVVSRKDFQDSGSEDSARDETKHSKNNHKQASDDSEATDDESVDEAQVQNNVKPNINTDSEDLSSAEESDDYSITNFKKQLQSDDDEEEEEDEGIDGQEDNETSYDLNQLSEPMKEDFEHVKKQNISEEAKKGICVRNQLLLWESLLEMRIHLQRCMNTANQMPLPEKYNELENNEEFIAESNTAKTNVACVLDK